MRDSDTRYFGLEQMEIPRGGFLQIGFREEDSALAPHSWDDPEFIEIHDHHPAGTFRAVFPHREGMTGGSHVQEYHLYYDVTEHENDVPHNQYSLQLVSIRCNDAQEYKDEVVLTVNGDNVWGAYDVKTGNTFDLRGRAPIEITRSATIDLWESDAHSRSDHLGRLNLVITDDFALGEELTHTFSWGSTALIDARYTLTYSVTLR